MYYRCLGGYYISGWSWNAGADFKQVRCEGALSSLCTRRGRVLNLRAPSSIIQVHIVFPLPLSSTIFFNKSTTFTVHLSLSEEWRGGVSTNRPTEALLSSRSWRGGPGCVSDTCSVPGAFEWGRHSFSVQEPHTVGTGLLPQWGAERAKKNKPEVTEQVRSGIRPNLCDCRVNTWTWQHCPDTLYPASGVWSRKAGDDGTYQTTSYTKAGIAWRDS